MSRPSRIVLLSAVLALGLGCGLISSPVSQVQNLASTAEALVTAIPSGVPNIPNIPDVSAYLNPTGTPATEWNGLPILPQATSGQEFNKSTYSFKSPAKPQADIEAFYDGKLKDLGWTSEFSAATGSEGGVLVFNKDSQVLTVMVTKSDQDIVVLLILE